MDNPTTAPQSSQTDFSQPSAVPPKKKGGCCGCGCFLSGCLILIFLIFGPVIGGSVYLASLSDAEWGDKIIWLVKNKSFSDGFKNGIRESKGMTEDEKKIFIQTYEELVDNYDRLTPDQQHKVKDDLVKVFKAFLKNPDAKTPPPELIDLMQLLQPGMIDNTAPDVTTEQTNNTQPQPTQPTNTYDFGGDNSNSNPTPTQPTQPQPVTNPQEPTPPQNNFDF